MGDEPRRKNKVLLALDESEESFYALKWALEHNMVFAGDTVILLHCQAFPPSYMIEPAPMFGAGMIMPPDLVATFRKQQEQTAISIFNQAKKLCEEHGVMNVTTMTAQGDAREHICETAAKTEVDVLILGSHGYGALKRALLGSVSDYCAHNVKCPVLIVKKPHEKKT